ASASPARLTQLVRKPSPCRANSRVSAIAASSSTIRMCCMAGRGAWKTSPHGAAVPRGGQIIPRSVPDVPQRAAVCSGTRLGQTAPQFVEVAEPPLLWVFASNDLLLAGPFGQVDDFLRQRQA